MARPSHPHAPQSRPRRHLPRQLAAPRAPGEQCRSPAPPPPRAPAFVRGAKGAQAGARDAAGAGPGATSLGRSLLLPQRPGCSSRRRPGGRRPSSGKETSYVKAAGQLPSRDALWRAHLTGPAPRPPARHPGRPRSRVALGAGPLPPAGNPPRAAPQCRPRSPAPPCAARLALAPGPGVT